MNKIIDVLNSLSGAVHIHANRPTQNQTYKTL